VDLSGNLLVFLHANPLRHSGTYRYHQLFTFLQTDIICIFYDIQKRQILSCAALSIWSLEWGLFSEVLSELRSYSLHWVASISVLLAYERATLLHSDWRHRTLCSDNSRDKSAVCTRRLREIVGSGWIFPSNLRMPVSKFLREVLRVKGYLANTK
jgi:hypothetical protein